jgi:23S rRNA (cytosine1962-C5)-methyltransferase
MQVSQLPIFFEHIESELAKAPNELRRLFHGRGHHWSGLEQLTCDWLQGQLIVSLFKSVDEMFLADLKSGLRALALKECWLEKSGSCIVIQHRYTDGAPS